MNKLLVICGPTATGKTALGISLAKKFNGEIVSADSRQVYIGMDLGTGKDLPVNSKFQVPSTKQIPNFKFQIGYYDFDLIPVWMLDIAKPNQEFSAADFVKLATEIITDITSRNKLPIVLGGTGFYLKALIDGVETLGVPPDWTLRRNLEKNTREKLFEMLSRFDSVKAASMNSSDRQNPRRLIRAIEVALKKSNFKLQNPASHFHLPTSTLFIGLTANYTYLYDRVDKRIDEQVKQGAKQEIRELLKQGYTWDLPAMTAMGYGIWKPYFENKQSKEEIISKWKFSEHAYCRRQMTWFKKDKRINWFDITKQNWSNDLERLVNQWYNPV
jgi:tRNA dimethylallyltransferase